MQQGAAHIASGAGVTVAGIRMPKSVSHQFGVIQTAPDGRRIAYVRHVATGATTCNQIFTVDAPR